MKVLIKGTYPYKNEDIWGGAESVLYNLKKGFNKYHSDINIEILSNNSNLRNRYEYYKDITYIRNPRIKFGSIFLSTYPKRIKKIIKIKDFDVLHSHSIDVAYYGLKYKNKLLFTLHGVTWEEEKYLHSFLKRFGWQILYSNRLKKILRKIKYVVSINPYITKLIESYSSAKIFEISNPIPNEFFHLEDKSESNRLFYIGIISRRKNLMNLVKALKIVDKENIDFKLFVAGKIENREYFGNIKKFVDKSKLNQKIKFLGVITDEEKLNQLKKMNFLVLPSLQETAPMVISEAFAAGKPVIASNKCGIPYMLNNEKNGLLINPYKIEDIADKIIYALNNSKEMKLKSKNAKKYANKNHNLKKVVKRYKNAYEFVKENSD